MCSINELVVPHPYHKDPKMGGERGGIVGTILRLCRDNGKENGNYYSIIGFIRVVVKVMAPFWIPIIVRPLIFRAPKKGSSF